MSTNVAAGRVPGWGGVLLEEIRIKVLMGFLRYPLSPLLMAVNLGVYVYFFRLFPSSAWYWLIASLGFGAGMMNWHEIQQGRTLSFWAIPVARTRYVLVKTLVGLIWLAMGIATVFLIGRLISPSATEGWPLWKLPVGFGVATGLSLLCSAAMLGRNWKRSILSAMIVPILGSILIVPESETTGFPRIVHSFFWGRFGLQTFVTGQTGPHLWLTRRAPRPPLETVDWNPDTWAIAGILWVVPLVLVLVFVASRPREV